MNVINFQISFQVPMRQSEVFISEKIDTLCKVMDDYARVRDKATGQIRVMNLMDSKGGMNALLSDYDFITDNDLNKSLKFYVRIWNLIFITFYNYSSSLNKSN